MTDNNHIPPDELKRRIRKLKHAEKIIRFQGNQQNDSMLVWNSFFDLRGSSTCSARYTLSALVAMSRDEYRRVVDEYFAHVYYELYKENGITDAGTITYNPAILAQLNLPFNASREDVKRKFRESAKIHHPDVGGDSAKFIELMKIYETLTGG